MTPLAVILFGFLFLPYTVVVGMLLSGAVRALTHPCRRPPPDVDLLDTLRPRQRVSLGDEAERWLRNQQ